VYGPVAFGTSAYARLSDWPGGGVVGIHGTNEPPQPGAGLARMHSRAERSDPPARTAHAGGYPGADPLTRSLR